jgi:hypothetical protein
MTHHGRVVLNSMPITSRDPVSEAELEGVGLEGNEEASDAIA